MVAGLMGLIVVLEVGWLYGGGVKAVIDSFIHC